MLVDEWSADNENMGKQHGPSRKRRTIDLDALTKKHRKLFREERSHKPLNQKDKQKTDVEETLVSRSDDGDYEENSVASEPESSSDDEQNPYQQLVSSLTGNTGSKGAHIDSDEEISEEYGSDDDDQDDEADDDEDSDDEKLKSPSSMVEANGRDGDDNGDEDDDGDDDGDDDDSEVSNAEDEESQISEEDDDDDDDDNVDDDDDRFQESDPFLVHFERDLEEAVADSLGSCTACKREEVKVSGLGSAFYQWPHDSLKVKPCQRKEKNLSAAHMKKSLCDNLKTANKKLCNMDSEGLTPVQSALFPILNNYQDVLYTERSSENGEQLRVLYCLHALNHVLKTRKRVISHNTKIKQKGASLSVDEEFRDQGLTRPKVLMILPFRDSAKRVVDAFIQLLNPTDQGFVANKKRFYQEYTIPPEEERRKGYKPDDFEELFSGHTDDHFRIGIGVAKKTLKLYTKFYMADIILASPLGLRTLIGAEGEKERDYDFLSSIEMLVVDQADVLMMQNWDHLLHIVRHLHLQPQEGHGVDFTRVRMWTLNGWAKYYRQTLVFSSVPVPEVTALVSKHCHNYCGKYQFIRKPSAGSICQIATQLPQVFHRIESLAYSQVPDDRFDYFIKKVFPHHSNKGMSQVLIFIPSYFDFVRLRNHFKREEINILQVCEYTKEKDVNTARNLLFHKKVPYMLYTERFHFYKRPVLRGIQHIIFYGLPQYPHLYSEMCNMLHDVKSKTRVQDQTCTVMYTKFDVQRLAEIVGTERASQMIHSQKAVHMFVTGENG